MTNNAQNLLIAFFMGLALALVLIVVPVSADYPIAVWAYVRDGLAAVWNVVRDGLLSLI